MEWNVHLLRQMRMRAVLVVLFVLAAAFCAQIVLGSPVWAFVALLVMVVYFSNVFFPIKYVLDSECISVETYFGTQSRKWDEFRRATFFRYGVNLVTRAKPSRFEFFRSLNVYLPPDSAEAQAFIRAELEAHAIEEWQESTGGNDNN